MSQEKVTLEPATIEGIQKGVKIVTLLAPPLAFGALTSTVVIGEAGAAAAITAVDAGKLFNSTRSLEEKSLRRPLAPPI